MLFFRLLLDAIFLIERSIQSLAWCLEDGERVIPSELEHLAIALHYHSFSKSSEAIRKSRRRVISALVERGIPAHICDDEGADTRLRGRLVVRKRVGLRLLVSRLDGSDQGGALLGCQL